MNSSEEDPNEIPVVISDEEMPQANPEIPVNFSEDEDITEYAPIPFLTRFNKRRPRSPFIEESIASDSTADSEDSAVRDYMENMRRDEVDSFDINEAWADPNQLLLHEDDVEQSYDGQQLALEYDILRELDIIRDSLPRRRKGGQISLLEIYANFIEWIYAEEEDVFYLALEEKRESKKQMAFMKKTISVSHVAFGKLFNDSILTVFRTPNTRLPPVDKFKASVRRIREFVGDHVQPVQPIKAETKRRGKQKTMATKPAPKNIGQSSSQPLDETNIGHSMLRAMGWTPGDALGSTSEGIKEPIQPMLLEKKRGLGYSKF